MNEPNTHATSNHVHQHNNQPFRWIIDQQAYLHVRFAKVIGHNMRRVDSLTKFARYKKNGVNDFIV